MKTPFRTALSAALMMVAGSMALPASAAPENLDSATWQSEIETAFADVKGYSAVLVNQDGFVVSRSGGMAGPGSSMSWDHYGNIGSVQKMIASLFLLRKMEDKLGRGNVPAIHAALDTPVYLWMPTRIQQATPNINKQITFRDLLTHKSGLRTEHSSGNPFIDFLAPINQADHGVRDYENTNIKLLTYVTVTYGAPHILTEVNNSIAQFNWSATSSNIPQSIGTYYWGMVQYQMLDEAPLEVFSSCWLADHIIDLRDAPVARMYWTRNDALNSGGWYDGGVAAGHCKGQGGWYWSTRMLARLFRDLGTNDGVISAATYNYMFDPDASSTVRDNRLGWSSQLGSAKLQSDYGWIASPYHGGSHSISWGGNTVTGRAAVMRLPGGYHSVALVNSSEMSSGDIANALKNAFARSLP